MNAQRAVDLWDAMQALKGAVLQRNSVVLACMFLCSAAWASDAQSLTGAVAGFSYAQVSEPPAPPIPPLRVCYSSPRGAAIGGAVGGFVVGALAGWLYGLEHTDANGGNLPFRGFLLVGAGVGAVFGALNPPVRCRDDDALGVMPAAEVVSLRVIPPPSYR